MFYKQVRNGRNLSYPLPNHINSHRDAHGDLTQDNDQIPFDVPNEPARLIWLLKSI